MTESYKITDNKIYWVMKKEPGKAPRTTWAFMNKATAMKFAEVAAQNNPGNRYILLKKKGVVEANPNPRFIWRYFPYE